jgi:hypothetical protein
MTHPFDTVTFLFTDNKGSSKSTPANPDYVEDRAMTLERAAMCALQEMMQ